MSKSNKTEPFVWKLFTALRLQRFPLGIDDYAALRTALRAGFGLGGRQQLLALCRALWAKSPAEEQTLAALFDLHIPDEEWCDEINLESEAAIDALFQNQIISGARHSVTAPASELNLTHPPQKRDGLPPLPDEPTTYSDVPFVFAPQFPLTAREITQTWRRLRHPLRFGPPTDLDIAATIDQRAHSGQLAPVLVPRRRNTARLLLLVDRGSGMTPFRPFVNHVCGAIIGAAKLGSVGCWFFNNTPSRGASMHVLEPLRDQMTLCVDSVLAQIAPAEQGLLYRNALLLEPHALVEVLREEASNTPTVVISDAGAARGQPDSMRLLNTVAFLKALHQHTRRYVWLNPLPARYWERGACAQIRRHVPMFALDRAGMEQAVQVLRGRPCLIEQPI